MTKKDATYNTGKSPEPTADEVALQQASLARIKAKSDASAARAEQRTKDALKAAKKDGA